jgi:GntR family transcriptional regulator/MocR family aminotransferase
MELPADIEADALSSMLAKQGILVESGERFYSANARRNCLRIAVSQIPESKIDGAVKSIRAAVRHQAPHKAGVSAQP